jgi:hypothetical protein
MYMILQCFVLSALTTHAINPPLLPLPPFWYCTSLAALAALAALADLLGQYL